MSVEVRFTTLIRISLTIKTPNILATSQRFPETLDQYFSNSLWAPSTLSTTSSVFASILWLISLCSETIPASCPKMLPSSFMVRSIDSIASERCWMYVFVGCASSMISNCWSDCCPPPLRNNADDEFEGSSDNRSGFELYPVRDCGRPPIPEPVAVDWYNGLSLRPASTICDRALTLETKL